MPVVRAAVLLAGFTDGDQINVHGEPAWYHEYFFGNSDSHRSYWLKQTDGEIVLEGQVFDWMFFEQFGPILSPRGEIARYIIREFEQRAAVDFFPFGMIFICIAAPRWIHVDGGSPVVRSKNRKHCTVVVRASQTVIGQNLPKETCRFDFIAHETGHGFGLHHSFGRSDYQIVGDVAGAYGHPYCIMSAMGYGGIAGPYWPSSLKDDQSAYAWMGPSLNAATALGRGWVHAHVHQLGTGAKEYEIRSRQFGGRTGALPPQALEIRAANGHTFVVDYREPLDWDRAAPAPVMILAHAKGSTADSHNPDSYSPTFLSMFHFPDSLERIVRGPGFSIEVLERSLSDRSIRVRVHDGSFPIVRRIATQDVQTVDTAIVARGSTTWVPNEKVCVRAGTYPYVERRNTQRATFELTHPNARWPITARWKVAGIQLMSHEDTLTPRLRAQIPNSNLESWTLDLSVTIECAVEALPTGSRLRLTNLPADGNYEFEVECEIETLIGKTHERFYASFNGMEFDYGEAFERERLRCLVHVGSPSDRFPTYEVFIPEETWIRIPKPNREIVEQYLKRLALVRSEDVPLFEQLVAELPRVSGVGSAVPVVVPRTFFAVDLTTDDHPPPLPPDVFDEPLDADQSIARQ